MRRPQSKMLYVWSGTNRKTHSERTSRGPVQSGVTGPILDNGIIVYS